MQFFGVADLAARWPYTRQGVHKLARSADFPVPAFAFNLGRQRVWALSDIEAFEATHPEVRSEAAKRHKIIGFRRAISKGRAETGLTEGEDGSANTQS